ncbi:MAG TPA: hypothetical protein VF215_00150 [Thermoanaerobaculia bacterium]
MAEPRYCSNCRAGLPEKADACPECGVYAGDLFDERSLRPRTRMTFVLALLGVIAVVAAFLIWQQKKPADPAKEVTSPPPSVRVVGDRPGSTRRAARAAINEAEATRILRRHLVATTSIASACLAIMSHGPQRGAYVFSAFNRCERTRIGRWRVDAKTGEASLAK